MRNASIDWKMGSRNWTMFWKCVCINQKTSNMSLLGRMCLQRGRFFQVRSSYDALSYILNRFTGSRASLPQNVSHCRSTDSAREESGQSLASFDWLSRHGPEFFIRGEHVQVIMEPTQFFEILKLKIRKAKTRITISSLYLGNGHLEQELVSCIRTACLSATNAGRPNMEVNILLDCTRGSRGQVSSRSLLCPLLAEFKSVQVSLYHTPDLRGLWKMCVPERFNETIGLNHMKVYLFDDSFIISGANLSHDYFTNRQDRYILFNNCSQLADFFCGLVKTVMSFSLTLSPDNKLHLAPGWNVLPYKGSSLDFKLAAKEKVESYLKSVMVSPGNETMSTGTRHHTSSSSCPPHNSNTTQASASPGSHGCDTAIYPLVQMGPFGITHDEQALKALFQQSNHHDNILLASGYFNLTEDYMSIILNQSLSKYSILMASPQANGFLGARGVAGAIPYAYVYLAHKFYKRIQRVDQSHRIHLLEYVREGWTFHGKGLWYYLPNQPLPNLVLVGSPNFGYRSVHRDLECQVVIVTENSQLRQQLREEHVRMFCSSQPVTENTFERRNYQVPLWVKCVTHLIKHFF